VLLLPLFFALTGMKTRLDLHGLDDLPVTPGSPLVYKMNVPISGILNNCLKMKFKFENNPWTYHEV